MASWSRLLELPFPATFWSHLLTPPLGAWSLLLDVAGDLFEPPLGSTSWRHLLEPPLGSASWSRLFDNARLPVRAQNFRVVGPGLRPRIPKDSSVVRIVATPKKRVIDVSFQTVKTASHGFDRLTFYSQKSKHNFFKF